MLNIIARVLTIGAVTIISAYIPARASHHGAVAMPPAVVGGPAS